MAALARGPDVLTHLLQHVWESQAHLRGEWAQGSPRTDTQHAEPSQGLLLLCLPGLLGTLGNERNRGHTLSGYQHPSGHVAKGTFPRLHMTTEALRLTAGTDLGSNETWSKYPTFSVPQQKEVNDWTCLTR